MAQQGIPKSYGKSSLDYLHQLAAKRQARAEARRIKAQILATKPMSRPERRRQAPHRLAILQLMAQDIAVDTPDLEKLPALEAGLAVFREKKFTVAMPWENFLGLRFYLISSKEAVRYRLDPIQNWEPGLGLRLYFVGSKEALKYDVTHYSANLETARELLRNRQPGRAGRSAVVETEYENPQGPAILSISVSLPEGIAELLGQKQVTVQVRGTDENKVHVSEVLRAVKDMFRQQPEAVRTRLFNDHGGFRPLLFVGATDVTLEPERLVSAKANFSLQLEKKGTP